MSIIEDLYTTVQDYNRLAELNKLDCIDPLYDEWRGHGHLSASMLRKRFDDVEQSLDINAKQRMFIEEILEDIKRVDLQLGIQYEKEIEKHLNVDLEFQNATKWQEIKHHKDIILRTARNRLLGQVSLRSSNVSWQVEKAVLDQLQSDNVQPWKEGSKEITVDGHTIKTRSGFDRRHACIVTEFLIIPSDQNPNDRGHQHVVISEDGEILANHWTRDR